MLWTIIVDAYYWLFDHLTGSHWILHHDVRVLPEEYLERGFSQEEAIAESYHLGEVVSITRWREDPFRMLRYGRQALVIFPWKHDPPYYAHLFSLRNLQVVTSDEFHEYKIGQEQIEP